DKATGKDAGSVLMPAQQSGSPMTYLFNGKQYIVVAIGGGNYPGELLAFRFFVVPRLGVRQIRERTSIMPAVRMSRRNFITTSGAGAAALCTANNAGGDTATEMQARSAEEKLTGVSKWDL